MPIKVKVEAPPDFTAEDVERDIEERPSLGLFVWTLTHSLPIFRHIGRSFADRHQLIEWVLGEVNRKPRETFAAPWAAIMKMALGKITLEWEEWMKLTEGQEDSSEIALDNALMSILYEMILVRDGKKCVRCGSENDIIIHHIMAKERGAKRRPPFGKSVPTNLATLCQNCHSAVDPYAKVD